MTTTDPGREVQLEAGTATFTLYAGNRALRMIERETGKSLIALFSDEGLEEIGIGTLTTLVWGLLQRNHQDLSIDEIDDIIDDAGYDAVMEAVGQALEVAMPTAPGGPQSSGKAPAGNGAGTRSSRARSRPGSASRNSGR